MGWIKLHREITRHWIFENPDHFRAWITILLEVNHCEKTVRIQGHQINLVRGQSAKSLESWGKLFGGWERNRVRRFFKELEKCDMIRSEDATKTTLLTVVNYCEYQDRVSIQCDEDATIDATIMRRRCDEDATIANPIKKERKKEEKKEYLFARSDCDAQLLQAGAIQPVIDAIRENYSDRLESVSEKTITTLIVELSGSLFSGVDVPTEIRKAALWEKMKPEKAKTPKGTPRFLIGWMDREQNKYRPMNPQPSKQPEAAKPEVKMHMGIPEDKLHPAYRKRLEEERARENQ